MAISSDIIISVLLWFVRAFISSLICLVLGIVALICPIEIEDFSPFVIARAFLIIAAMFFLFFIRTDRKVTTKEALFLLGLYIVFLLIEIFDGKTETMG